MLLSAGIKSPCMHCNAPHVQITANPLANCITIPPSSSLSVTFCWSHKRFSGACSTACSKTSWNIWTRSTYLSERRHNISSTTATHSCKSEATAARGEDGWQMWEPGVGRRGLMWRTKWGGGGVKEVKDKWSNDTMCVLLWNVWRREVLPVCVSSFHPSVWTFDELPSNPPHLPAWQMLYIRPGHDPKPQSKHWQEPDIHISID